MSSLTPATDSSAQKEKTAIIEAKNTNTRLQGLLDRSKGLIE